MEVLQVKDVEAGLYSCFLEVLWLSTDDVNKFCSEMLILVKVLSAKLHTIEVLVFLINCHYCEREILKLGTVFSHDSVKFSGCKVLSFTHRVKRLLT